MVLFSIIYFDNIFNYVHNHNDSDPVFKYSLLFITAIIIILNVNSFIIKIR